MLHRTGSAATPSWFFTRGWSRSSRRTNQVRAALADAAVDDRVPLTGEVRAGRGVEGA
jgi:hypothetical protein